MAYTFNPFTGTFDNAPSTLKGDSAYSTLCAISGDLVTQDYLHDGFLPLSGGTVTGNLSVEGNFEVGTNSTATIYAEGTLVGINTETPNEELTVVGSISATEVVYASGGNSNIWNESYSLIQSNSASWVSDSTIDSEVRALTSGWVGGNDAYTNLVANSAAYLSSVDLSFLSVSANWDSVYNTVNSNSATAWNYQGFDLKALSGTWQSTYTTVNTNSASWASGPTGVYLPLSGGTVTGNLSVAGNFDVGTNPIATLYAGQSAVGINTETPNEELTVVGDISATGVVYASGGNSNLWNNAYVVATAYSAASSTFLTSETDSQTLTFNESTKNLSISNGNTVSLSALLDDTGMDTGVRALTSNWQNTYTNYSTNSASYATNSTVNSVSSQLVLNTDFNSYKTNVASATATLLPTSVYQSASGVWQDATTVVQANSAQWAVDSTLDAGVRALTAGWVGGNDAYTNLISNSAAYLSAVDLSFLSVSASWNSVYNTVQSNSAANWNYQGSDIKALTGNWESTYTTFRDASSTFLTSETDSQTLSFNEGTKDLSISNGNTVSLSGITASGAYLPLSGGTVTGNLSVARNFDVGTNPIATLYAGQSAVGINTETPNEELTVVGDISATGVVYASGGNSNLWNNAYVIATAYSTASSTFLTSETDSQTLSFNEGTKDLSISNGNTVSLSAFGTGIDTGVRTLTSNWQSTYTTVLANSSSWVNGVSAEKVLARVYNADTVAMSKGDVVYTFGATGDVMSVKLAYNASDATSARTLGFVNETIATGGIGYVVIAGQIDKMSFPLPFQEGDALWLGSTPGSFTRVKPTAPEHGVYLGVVERANNGNGLAYVKVQNGYELDEIHDVLITSVSAGDVIRRNSSNNLWTNTKDGAKWDSVYTTVTAASSNWQSTYTDFSTNSATYVKTVATTTPGTSAITTIVAVSAMPVMQTPGTLYILM
jgi:hypothetical protein